MYSFAQRDGTTVVDEPFYAHYLLQSGTQHPGRAKVIESQPKDPAIVMQNLMAASNQSEVLFIKNMAHHMINMDQTVDALINTFTPVFLIRDPREMLLSLDKTLPDPTLRDTGYQHLLTLFEIIENKELPLTVIDSKELLKDPAFVLSALCEQLNISFDEAMLSWRLGPIPEDGIWAEYWYENVHQSKGFNPYTPKDEPLPARMKPLYEHCKSIYDRMFAHAIKK
jgi:hypothetical protein